MSYAEQQQKLQVDKDGINLSYAEQQQKLQVDKDGINLSYAEQQNAPRRVGHTSEGNKALSPSAAPTNAAPSAAPTNAAPSAAPTNAASNEQDNTSEQTAGPVRFAFVDSFWTDYTALGGVVASTSSESTTAQPLPPATRQESEPGQGEAVLAVVLRNRGFADATGISGSLNFPSGFKAIVTPENVHSDTALASYNGVVKAGQTFTLYFRVEITENTQVGKEYTGELRIRYFKVAEQEDENTRSTTLDVPFRLSGRVILTAAVNTSSSSTGPGSAFILSNAVSLKPGIVNPLQIEISNNGSATSTGVIVNVLAGTTVSSSSIAQTQGDDGGGSTVNNNSNSGVSTTTSTVAQESLSSSSSSSSPPATLVVVGSPTFNIGPIGAKEKKQIVAGVLPADTETGAITSLNIEISYNDAYGNKRTQSQIIGLQVLPESPQSGLNVLPTTSTSLPTSQEFSQIPITRTALRAISSNSNFNGGNGVSNTSTNSSSSQSKTLQIVAGSVQDLTFVVTNDNDIGISISDVVVSLNSESTGVRILGDSHWNLQSVAPHSTHELSTRVYASTSLIGSPVFFTVTMQYIRNGNELRTQSFPLGAIIVGDIKLSISDVAISYIGDTPNLVGHILNQGNTPALFTKIELLEQSGVGNPRLLQPIVASQFLGDLPVNSPVPFNIPLQITQQNTIQQMTRPDYPISIAITYSDEMRNTHKLLMNETVNLGSTGPRMDEQQSIQQQQQPSSSEQGIPINNGFVDAYWVSSTTAATASSAGNSSDAAASISSSLPSEREVGPGEGPSFLAVVLSNTAFSDITGIVGYLALPKGFAATSVFAGNSTSNDTASNMASPQTAIASLSNIVKAGQTYTLYFKVNVLKTAQIGFHEAVLRINYFRVPEPEPGTYRVQTITVPFELPGKVILDASSETNDLAPGEANEVKLKIRNIGSADAHGVIININAAGGSIITNNMGADVNTVPGNNSSDQNAETGVQGDQQQQQQPPPSSTAAVSVGTRTFNIGTLPANGSTDIVTTIYPSTLAGGTLQSLDIEISYNDANGNRRSTVISPGFRVLPNPPERGLNIAPSSAHIPLQGEIIPSSAHIPLQGGIIAVSSITGSLANNPTGNASSNKSSEIVIIAGRTQDLNFNITNNNRNPITDVVVTLVPRSDSVAILGNSRWTLQELSPQSKARFSSRVFASESLIGSPISFDVRVQYILGDQLKSDSFSLGANVMGEIRINVNDLAIKYIGDSPNLTGNLLNQGNTKALFTTIEMQRNITPTNQSTIIPVTDTPQYLGDLENNSPLPFSIPLTTGIRAANDSSNGMLAAGIYPLSLKIRYSDELRNIHEVILNGTVSYNPPVPPEQSPNQGFLGFGSSAAKGGSTTQSVLPLVVIFAAIVAAAVVIIIVIRRRSRSKKISRLMRGQDDNDDFETSLGEHSSSRTDDDSSSSKH
ncbi:MAG: hypothetical protein M3258_01270 [Thermoproteota archaeon]|nr:hypothetical protein [Thermoproteota archaeon]